MKCQPGCQCKKHLPRPPLSVDARERIAASKRGVPRSAETRAKIGAAGRGRVTSKETKDKLRKTSSVHGMHRTPTYRSWDGMIQRCGNPRAAGYATYGAVGVKVCERWRDFRNFLEDMGERPAGRSIDRIDNSKGYEPGNCRWATHSEQMKNRPNFKPDKRSRQARVS